MSDPSIVKPVTLALTPSGRAICAALVDPLGLVWCGHLRFPSALSGEETIRRTKDWFSSVIAKMPPTQAVQEQLHRLRLTRQAWMLSGLLESLVEQHGIRHLKRQPRLDALTWLCRESPWKSEEPATPTVRLASRLLARDHADVALHPPKDSRVRTEWDRTHGQAIAAASLALHAMQTRKPTTL